jgi:DnaA regulatory inactivator Hda
MAEQLTFDLPVRESRAQGDFFVSDANALAVARLESPDTWPNRKLALFGPKGAGKTHLAHVWAERLSALILEPDMLADLAVTGVQHPVVLDNADSVHGAQEEALFHLHNHLGHSGLPFLLVARDAPARWQIALPDLKSRMAATDTVRIDGPDDALLAMVMVKQFADRQLMVAPNVISWLVRHMDRSFAEAQRLVEALDQMSLAEGRAITRPLAQKVLENLA